MDGFLVFCEEIKKATGVIHTRGLGIAHCLRAQAVRDKKRPRGSDAPVAIKFSNRFSENMRACLAG